MRRADTADLEAIVETFVLAFFDDPTWAWAFPDPSRRAERYRWLWGLCAQSSLRQGGLWTTRHHEAVAAWIPPGGDELSPEQAEEVDRNVEPQVRELLARFDQAHPHGPPHWYLSLLATHPDHRGHGYGMDLLRHNLEQFDAAGVPAYLESSNSANDRRYEALGFRRRGAFTTPGGSVSITTMWREPRP